MSAIHHSDERVTLQHGDCLDILAELPDCSVDSVVTDPPYGISFMGKAWDQPGQYGSQRRNGTPGMHQRERSRTAEQINDGGAMDAGRYDLSHHAMRNFQSWCEAWTTECLRVLKPGGHLLSFGGSRTWHRLVAGAEDAGFEIRDSIAWLFGSGFPKSLDVSKAIDRSAGAIRAAGEMTRDRTSHLRNERYASGPAGFSVDRGTDLAATAGPPVTAAAEQWQGWGTALKPAFEPIMVARKPLTGTVAGNVLTHGTGALNIDACRVGSDDRTNNAGGSSSLQRVSRVEHGYRDSVTSSVGQTSTVSGRWPANVVLDEDQAEQLDQQSGELTSGANPTRRGSDKFREAYGDFKGQEDCSPARGADIGGASRFFYTAKASSDERIRHDGTAHPTVKPLALMRWLVRLVTPTGGTVLEPFAGSGTTVEACILEGFRCIAIEREADYLPLITQRINRRRDPIAYLTAAGDDLGLFDLDGGAA